MIKPGGKDRKASILITGMELDELQRFVWMMAESFGLDRRIANCQGVRPIGLYRWDIECLVDVINSVLDDPEYYPNQDSTEYEAINNLHDRLQVEEDALYAQLKPSTRKR
jgi:anaerobic ribonucleoside-triphosphate reductase